MTNQKEFKENNIINSKKEVYGMWPFKGPYYTKRQQIFAVVSIIIGIFLMIVTVPFIVKIMSFQFLSTTIGFILFIIGIIYLLDAKIS